MPLPMVHLAVAVEYAKNYPSLINCPEFFLGSITPDAIHMRKGTNREDKGVTHLRTEEVELWKRNILDFHRKNKDNKDYNLLLGYSIHIFTDIIWHETLYSAFIKAYENDPHSTLDMKRAYYRDTDSLDYELYKTCEWREALWELLQKVAYSSIDGLLSAEEIELWNLRVLKWFDEGESKFANETIYINIGDLKRFIIETGEKITKILVAEEI